VRTHVVNRVRVLGIRLDVHRVLPYGAFLRPDVTPNPDQLLNLRRANVKGLIVLINSSSQRTILELVSG
jgi:hypothetical protein